MHSLKILTYDTEESWSHRGWKSHLRSWSLTANLSLPSPPLNHIPQYHIYNVFHIPQGMLTTEANDNDYVQTYTHVGYFRYYVKQRQTGLKGLL